MTRPLESRETPLLGGERGCLPLCGVVVAAGGAEEQVRRLRGIVPRNFSIVTATLLEPIFHPPYLDCSLAMSSRGHSKRDAAWDATHDTEHRLRSENLAFDIGQ